MGGTCLNVGCIPAKTFLRSSKLFHECAEAAAYGVRVGSFELDMPAVVERKNRVVSTLTKGVEGMLKRAGVETIAGEARLVARNAVEVGEWRYEAANILLATGSRPAVPPIPGIHVRAGARFRYGLRAEARAGKGGHHRRRVHRPGVRLLLQRDRLPGQRVRDAAADRHRGRPGNLQPAAADHEAEGHRIQPLRQSAGHRRRHRALPGRRWHARRRHRRLHSERHRAARRMCGTWAWKRWAWISAPRESRPATRARPTWPAYGPAGTSPAGACWPTRPRAKESSRSTTCSAGRTAFATTPFRR